MTAVRVLSSEESAILEQYYKENYVGLYRFALYSIRDTGLAEVAVQETFLYVSKHMDKFLASPKPVGWLYLAMKNTIRHLIRERNKLMKRNIIVESELLESKDDPTPKISELNMEGNADLKLLERYYIQGVSLQELAEELHISVPAMKMRIDRAKKRLQKDPVVRALKNFEY